MLTQQGHYELLTSCFKAGAELRQIMASLHIPLSPVLSDSFLSSIFEVLLWNAAHVLELLNILQ